MTGTAPGLPAGFVVRLHDDVVVDELVRRGTRILRLSPIARSLISGREVRADTPLEVLLADQLLTADLAVPVLDGIEPRWLDDVTVVVPVRDRPAGIDRLLAALAPAVRCIVVDDASHDARLLARVVARHDARLVRLDRNVGPAAARNIGLAEVATPYVAFIDSDVTIEPAALRRLLAHFADPGLAAVAPRVRSRGGRRWFERYEDACGALDLGPTPATIRQWSPVAYVPSACLLARVERLGAGFDERLVSGEDVDLVWRLLDEGQRVRHAAEIDAWHDARSSVRGWLGRTMFYGTSAAPLARRHGARVAPAVLTRSSLLPFALLLAPKRWIAPLAVVVGVRAVREVAAELPEVDLRAQAGIAASRSTVTGRQIVDLALRHWWPVSLLLAAGSGRARRLLAAAAVAEGVASYRRADTTLDPARFVAARRLRDLAYGSGVWWSAARGRSIACLRPHWLRAGRPRP